MVVVERPENCRLEPAGLFVRLAADESVARRRRLDAVLEQLRQQPKGRVEPVGRDAEVVEEIAAHRVRVPAVPDLCAAVDHASGRVGVEDGDLFGGLVGEPHVVGVEEADQRAVRRRHAERPRGAHAAAAAVRVPDEPDATGLGAGEALGDLGAAVGRAVVDDNELEVAVGLIEGALDRLREEALAVADDRHGRDERLRHRAELRAAAASG